MNQDYSEALVAQFEREVDRREQDIVNRVQAIADAKDTVRMAIDLSRPQADVSVYVNDARGVSKSHQLDFLDFRRTTARSFPRTNGRRASATRWTG